MEPKTRKKREVPEPIVTRIKERRMVEQCGKTFEVEETIYYDFGPKQGITTVYIRPSVPSSPAMLQAVLHSMGYRLVPPGKG